ncbi:MAG: DUF6765 family protein [Acidimicrobiales bacterium]
MDQDFHYYGTYFAARTAGVDDGPAARIARASNFIDFMHEGDYGGRWKLIANTASQSARGGGGRGSHRTVGRLTNPRYTFQSGKLSVGVAPEDGLWCSYHFTPGNYDHIDAPSVVENHGAGVAAGLPPFETRTVRDGIAAHAGPMLNRPLSALSRSLFADAVACASGTTRLEKILERSLCGDWLLSDGPPDVLDRFGQLLLGVRAHVIADTWAHQDWSGIDQEINTYFDISNSFGRQAIEYQDLDQDQDSDGEWKRVVLSSLKHENLQAVPNATSYLGHGWMGHFPDYSFVSYRYKPAWRDKDEPPIVRNNPEQYRHAFAELCSLFSRAGGGFFEPDLHQENLDAAARAIAAPCEIASSEVCPRQASSEHWLSEFGPLSGVPGPDDTIDAQQEPDERARLAGLMGEPRFPLSLTRWGEYTVDVSSDLYLFQIAADYHFQFVKHWLSKHQIREFTGSWSRKTGPVDPSVTELF